MSDGRHWFIYHMPWFFMPVHWRGWASLLGVCAVFGLTVDVALRLLASKLALFLLVPLVMLLNGYFLWLVVTRGRRVNIWKLR